MIFDLLEKNPLQVNGKKVSCMKDSEKILVNINRLYFRRTQIIQNNCLCSEKNEFRLKEIQIIDSALKKTKYERQAFVEMPVKDVKFCFNSELIELPYNSFRRINVENIDKAKEYSEYGKRKNGSSTKKITSYKTKSLKNSHTPSKNTSKVKGKNKRQHYM